MAGKLELAVLDDAAYAEWSEFVAKAPSGSLYSTPEYLDALCTAAGGSYQIVGVRRAAELVGGIGLYRCATGYGSYVTPRLLLYYNGFVLKGGEGRYPSKQTALETETLDLLGQYLSSSVDGAVSLRCRSAVNDVRPLLKLGWTASPSYSYVISIADLKSAWERVEQNLRRLVRRCESQGMELSCDDDFDGFHRLHRLTLARKGAGRYLPADAFRTYYDILARQGLCKLFQVRTDGRVIATQLVLLGPHPVSHTVAAATDPEFMSTGVSALLRWKTLEKLAGDGYSGNDLTDAELNSITHFKSQLGGDLELNLVLERPRTLAFRLGTAATDLGWKVRGVLGGIKRRLRGRESR